MHQMPHSEFFHEEAAGEHHAFSPQRKLAQTMVWIENRLRMDARHIHSIAKLVLGLEFVNSQQEAEIRALFDKQMILRVEAHITASEEPMKKFVVVLIAVLASGAQRSLTDQDGLKVAVDPSDGSAGTYTPVDASDGTIDGGTPGVSGALVFTGPNGEDWSRSDNFTWEGVTPPPPDTIAKVIAQITPV